MATLADLQNLQKRQQLAQMMALRGPTGPSQGARAASGLSSLVAALAGRNLGNKVESTRAEIDKSDAAALAGVLQQGGDISQVASGISGIQKPETRELALALLGRPGGPLAKQSDPFKPVSGVGMFNTDSGEFITSPAFVPPETPDDKREKDRAAALDKEQDKLGAKADAKLEEGKVANEQGAQGFLKRVSSVRRIMDEAVQAGVDPDDLFGPLQSGEGIAGSLVRGTSQLVGTDAEKFRRRLEREFANMELDVAKMKLKGQGQITESERAIAKQTIPGLSLPDSGAAEAVLADIEAEANSILGGSEPIEEIAEESKDGPPDGTIIRNPSTGEQLILQGGQWVPHG